MEPFSKTKLFNHLDRLGAWASGKTMPPVLVELDLTNLCNHACPGCTFSYLVNVSKDSIPFDLAKKLVRELAAFGVKALTFSGGGEPLVYGQDRVLELMRIAREVNLQTALITNGSLMTNLEYLDLCEWVRVSLDGYDADTFAEYHGRKIGEFSKVCGNTRAMCAESLKRKAAGDRCATVGVGFLTKPGAYKDIKPMTEFCKNEFPGLDYLQFRPLVINMVDDPSLTGGGWGPHLVDQLAMLEAAVEMSNSSSLPVLWAKDKYHALHEDGFGKTYDKCYAHFLEATVSADCKVYVCCHTQGQERFCLGDLTVASFSDVWESDRARKIIHSFDPRTTCPPACRLHVYNSMLHEMTKPSTHSNYI